MPTPTKFLTRTQATVIEILAAGGSLREAARGAGISHRTLGRWIDKGRTAHPEGRWHRFYLEVEAARAGGPELVDLGRRFEEVSPEWLWKYVQDEWKPDPPAPVGFTVVLADGTPLDGRPVGSA